MYYALFVQLYCYLSLAQLRFFDSDVLFETSFSLGTPYFTLDCIWCTCFWALQLRLPGCRRLTADGIVTNVKAHRECSMPGLKQLRIHGLLGITREHIEKLNYLLDGGLQKKSQSVKPRFYNGRYCSLSTDDDSTIDIQVCPRCGDATRVYDCPNSGCQNQADHTVRECRACTFCIARCCDCGRCIDNDGEYEETFHFEMRCADCVRASEVPRMEIAWLR